MRIMKKKMSIELIIASVSLCLLLLVLVIAGCNQPVVKPENNNTLFNESINNQIDNLTNPDNIDVETKPKFEEFDFKYAERPEAKYEIARDDVFSMGNLDLISTDISFLGIMLGDSKQDLLDKIGTPNSIYEPADGSYQNYGYGNAIGIAGTSSGILFHMVDDKIERITVFKEFNKYLHGNTTMGQEKQMIYALLDVPDYQDFISNFRVFYYVEKGIEVYLRTNNADRISFIQPTEFKGVEYVSTPTDIGQGVIVNTTQIVVK